MDGELDHLEIRAKKWELAFNPDKRDILMSDVGGKYIEARPLGALMYKGILGWSQKVATQADKVADCLERCRY